MPDHTTTLEPGCYLDGSRGHYLTRDAIELAVSLGFMLDSFERYAVDRYEFGEDDYPFDGLVELCDRAVEWLNSGTERMPGQNLPPTIPADCLWDFNDGDFGLYPVESD
jgi:hypothetical protein